ncbi:MAG TPA: AtpZ/AtpI family protein [Limnochordales bacterium]|nr:AtpZ/AtpI family protein [Limnochordales bacterium]
MLRFPADYGRYGTIGISLVLTTGVYIYLGYRVGTWLDERWQTAPVCMVLGIVLGMVLSMLSLVKEVMALQRTGPSSTRSGEERARVRDSENENFPEGDDPRDRNGSPAGKDGR